MYHSQVNSATSNSKVDKSMSEEQFNQIVDAILSGKYSWACLLILRFTGYNPLHYIPYRTYNRLMKANRKSKSQLVLNEESPKSSKFKDLVYLEEIEYPLTKIKGGTSVRLFPIMTDLISSNLDLSGLNRDQKNY